MVVENIYATCSVFFVCFLFGSVFETGSHHVATDGLELREVPVPPHLIFVSSI